MPRREEKAPLPRGLELVLGRNISQGDVIIADHPPETIISMRTTEPDLNKAYHTTWC
jgi:hypothetical protein